MRRAAIAAALLAAGCASAPALARPSTATRSAVHRLAVTVRVEPAASASRAPPTGILEGMGEGAAAPFRSYWEFMNELSDDFAGRDGHGDGQGAALVVTIGAVYTAVVAVGGSVYGAFATIPEEDAAKWTAVFRDERADAGPDLGLAGELRRAIAESGTPILADDGSAADATLDVVLRDPVIVCEGAHAPTALLLFEATAELRPAGAAPVPLGRFGFASGKRPFLEWTAAPSPIHGELRLGARQVADAIVDYALRLETKDGR